MKNFIRFYFLFSVITVMFSCSDDNDSEEPQVRDGGEVFTSQLVKIIYDGSLQEQYTGVLGSLDIDLIKTTDTELVFVVPSNIEIGNTSLRIPGLNDLQINYSIQSTILQNTSDDTINQMLDSIDLFVNDLNNEDAAEINPVTSAFSDSFEGLTDEEKEQAALFYEANRSLINEILESADFSRIDNSELNRSIHISDASLIIKFKASGVFFSAGVALAILGVEPIEKGIGVLVAVVALKKFNQYKREIDSRSLKVFSAVVDGISASLQRNSNIGDIEFVDGEEKTLDFEVDRRDFMSSDTNEGAAGIIDYFNAFNLVNTAINKLNQVITFVNDNLFFSNISLIDSLSENEAILETTSVTDEGFTGFQFSVTDSNIDIASIGFDDGALKLTLEVINQDLVVDGIVNTNLQYTYNDDFNSIAGSFDISITSEVNIFGTWTITENSDCVSTNGETFTDNGTASLTLNEDFTVVLVDDSNGNYITNGFTFENGILSASVSYQIFFDDEFCGAGFQTRTNSMSLTYDELSDSFIGNSQGTQNEFTNGPSCTLTGFSCNGAVTLTR